MSAASDTAQQRPSAPASAWRSIRHAGHHDERDDWTRHPNREATSAPPEDLHYSDDDDDVDVVWRAHPERGTITIILTKSNLPPPRDWVSPFAHLPTPTPSPSSPKPRPQSACSSSSWSSSSPPSSPTPPHKLTIPPPSDSKHDIVERPITMHFARSHTASDKKGAPFRAMLRSPTTPTSSSEHRSSPISKHDPGPETESRPSDNSTRSKDQRAVIGSFPRSGARDYAHSHYDEEKAAPFRRGLFGLEGLPHEEIDTRPPWKTGGFWAVSLVSVLCGSTILALVLYQSERYGLFLDTESVH